jgi:hypothetical protein
LEAVVLKEVMDKLLANLIAEVGGDGMCAKTLMPGDSVLAEYVGLEGCGGMLWVRLVTAGPSATFPQIGIRPDNCSYELAVPLEVGVLRMAPPAEVILGREPILPSNEQQTAAVHQQIDDMEAMRRAIRKTDEWFDEDSVLGAYQPIGPESGVIGGSWQWTVSVP